jgi:hypothetical protein
MTYKKSLSLLICGIFSTALLLNCTAKESANRVFATKIQSMEDVIVTIEDAISQSDLEAKTVTGLQKKITSKPANSFDELELQAFVNLVLNKYGADLSREGRSSLRTILSFLSKKLISYKISGFSFALDPNLGLIWDTQNPSFTAIFKDARGNVKSRIFDALIYSIGLKYAFSINFNFIFFTGDIDFENSTKTLELGTGIDISLTTIFPPLAALPASIFVLYAPLKNAPGGLVMVGIPIGYAGGVSMVTGGTLTPRIN